MKKLFGDDFWWKDKFYLDNKIMSTNELELYKVLQPITNP
jgi:hypothetical protein